MITNGSQWPIEDLNEKSRPEDLKGALGRGNFKSTKENGKFLSKAIIKEIKKGWELIFPLLRAIEIRSQVMSPMGVSEKLGLSAT